MSITQEEVKRLYPLHWLIWNNNSEELKNRLLSNELTSEDLELKDPRGRTPLLLAITLGHIECVTALIEAGANANCEKEGWTGVHEAIAWGDPGLLAVVAARRDQQRRMARARGVPQLLRRLSLAPDFYVEMNWEFTSWVPLVSRVCPFDTYKVYKRGGNVRVDTTLVGFENNKWLRGDRTYIFQGQGNTASFIEVDHELGTWWCDRLEADEEVPRRAPPPPRRWLKRRLSTPLAINYLDTDKISFERNKSGMWGWRQDKWETVNGYQCKVFSANNVEVVSKTRCEHVPRGATSRPRVRTPLHGLLGLADAETAEHRDAEPLAVDAEEQPQVNGTKEELPAVTWEEYFGDAPLEREIGRPRDMTTKVQKFRATLWLCEEYPLEFQEQIMPILDLMASISSPHFAKLKDFIQMQLPSGFPVKIEIPLFHVMNARITFGNIFATESAVPHVGTVREGDRLACLVDDECFEISRAYAPEGAALGEREEDADEGLLQYAIHQSLMEAGTHLDQVDVWEALRGERPSAPPSPRPGSSPHRLLLNEDAQLQRAIEASLSGLSLHDPARSKDQLEDQLSEQLADQLSDQMDELERALKLSALEQKQRLQELEAEQSQLDEALRLSLIDK